MKNFINNIFKKARENPKTIVLPEGDQERILEATEGVLKKGIAKIILLGQSRKIKTLAKKSKLKIDWEKIKIIDHRRSKLKADFIQQLYELRKDKGLTKKQAEKLLEDANYFGTMLVYNNLADGMVTGTLNSTADSIRPALQIIKTKEKFHKVSGIFFMVLEKKLLLFADTAVTIEPTPHDLVDIAIDTAETAEKFGIKPKIALLSFSTKGSANHPNVQKIQEAVAMLKYERPDLNVDGELQVDAALVPEIAKRKCPKSKIQGNANVLIFPNLEAANIAYKLVERLAKAKAIGPLLQGLKKPINDLSRGCSFQDIINVVAFTVCECQETV